MDYRERGSHARGVYPTQYTSKGEARGKSRHKYNSKRVRNMEGRNVGTISGKSPKQGLTSDKNLTMEFSTDASYPIP